MEQTNKRKNDNLAGSARENARQDSTQLGRVLSFLGYDSSYATLSVPAEMARDEALTLMSERRYSLYLCLYDVRDVRNTIQLVDKVKSAKFVLRPIGGDGAVTHIVCDFQSVFQPNAVYNSYTFL